MLIIAFIQTLKQGNEKCGKDDVFKLVKDSLDEKIARETFEELLESLIQSQSIKPTYNILREDETESTSATQKHYKTNNVVTTIDNNVNVT